MSTADPEPTEPSPQRPRRAFSLVLVLLVVAVAVVGWRVTRSQAKGRMFCTAEGVLLADGTTLTRDNDRGCDWGDASEVVDRFTPRSTWRPVSAPPRGVVDRPAMSFSRRGLDDEATRVWAADADVEAELGWLRAHPPKGFEVAVVGTGAGLGQRTHRSIRFDPIGQDRSALVFVSLVATLADDGAGTTYVRVDVQLSSNAHGF